MNLEIKEKYDNFIKMTEKNDKKEKIQWLEQNNNHNKYIDNLLTHNEDVIIANNNINNSINTNNFKELYNSNGYNQQINSNKSDCDCNLSHGFTSSETSELPKSSEASKLQKQLKSSETSELPKPLKSSKSSETSELPKSSKSLNYIPNYVKNNHNSENDQSLLEDDYQLKNSKNKKLNKIQNQTNSMNSISSIDSEFKNIFNTNLLKENINGDRDENISIKNKLEKMYSKILKKKNANINQNPNPNTNNYDLEKYFSNDKMKSKDEIIKKISYFCEKTLFEDSTKGWNFEHDIYIVNFTKLLENLKKIIFTKNHNIKIGFFYRDFTNPKTNIETDFTKYWIGYENSNKHSNIKKIEYTIKNKILYYSFKNLSKSLKFKKRIGKTYYKIFKKTVQVMDNKNLIIDLMFYIGLV